MEIPTKLPRHGGQGLDPVWWGAQDVEAFIQFLKTVMMFSSTLFDSVSYRYTCLIKSDFHNVILCCLFGTGFLKTTVREVRPRYKRIYIKHRFQYRCIDFVVGLKAMPSFLSDSAL